MLLLRPSLAALVFVGSAVVHAAIAVFFSDQMYYVSAAFADLFVISFLASLDTLDTRAIQLQALSAISLICNFSGWALWLAYLEPTYYDAAVSAIYLAAIAVMLQGDGNNGNGRAGLYTRFHSYVSAWRMARNKYGATI